MAEIETLMAELSWLKRLASALVRDEGDASDLVQDTWLVAAEHAPTDGRPLKPWLSRVALNLVRMRSRSSTRRRAREAALEPSEASPTPDELVGRLRAQRVVADEVLKLSEPYRDVVLLHFFEELSSAEIARRFSIPEGTVRRRLKTALDELRGRLHAEESKTGQPVVALLAPLAFNQGAAAALGAVVVKKIIALAIVAIGLVLVGAHLYNRPATSAGTPAPQVAAGSITPPSVPASTTAHLSITVSDKTGPIANAFVRCAPTDGEVVVVKTGGDGTATLELARGQWSVAASADGHEPAAATVVVDHDDHLALVLVTGGQTLTGVVTDMTGGVIAGARIDAAQLMPDTRAGSAVAVAFSDASGHYQLALRAGAILVAASHPEYAAQARRVDLGTNGATANFSLVPGGVIEGFVRDQQSNEPVAGAIVRAKGDSAIQLGDVNDHFAKTDASGAFRFAGLHPAAYELSARDRTRSSRASIGVGIGVAEQQTNVTIRIGATATLRGKVVDERGAPVANVTVSANGINDGDAAISDETGAFVFRGLPPGRWALGGSSSDHLPDGLAIVELAEADLSGVTVRVRPGLELTGHVEPRQPCDVDVANAEPGDLFPRSVSITTAADGEFHAGPYRAGTATLSARCPSGDQGTAAISVGTGAVLPVAPGGSIEGRVLDTAGKPVSGIMVNAQQGPGTQIMNGVIGGLKAVTSPDGTFAIAALGAADYRLSVLDPGGPIKLAKPKTRFVKQTLGPGQHATGVELVVERRLGSIQGTVTGPDGTPVPDAWVSVQRNFEDQLAGLGADDAPADGSRTTIKQVAMPFPSAGGAGPGPAMPSDAATVPPAITDARGHFEMTVPPGRYAVTAEAQAGKLRGSAAEVTTDAQVSIQLAATSALHGSVHGARGPTELFTVSLSGPAPDHRQFTGGSFEFRRLAPGDYTIEVESSDGSGRATVRVPTDQPIDIALTPNGTVTGRVVDIAGNPVSGIGVALIADQPANQLSIELHEQPVTTGPDGRFSVAGQPGTRTLVVLGSAPTAKRGLAVTAGKTLDLGDLVVPPDSHR